jgi:hypothetical protein
VIALLYKARRSSLWMCAIKAVMFMYRTLQSLGQLQLCKTSKRRHQITYTQLRLLSVRAGAVLAAMSCGAVTTSTAKDI